MGRFKTELSEVKKPYFADGVVPPKVVFKRVSGRYIKGYEATPAGVSWSATRYCWIAKIGSGNFGLKHFRTKEEAIAHRNKLITDNYGADQVRA